MPWLRDGLRVGMIFVLGGILIGQPVMAQEGDTTLAYGQTVTGVLSDQHYEDRWTFAGQGGDVITLVMGRTVDEPGGLDGYLILLGPDGTTLQEVDDTQDSVMPALENYELPADGIYTAVATRFGFANGISVGEYTLTLTKVESGGAGVPEGEGGRTAPRWVTGGLPPGLHRISYLDPVDGTIAPDDFDDWFIFRGHADDVITLRMAARSGDLDPFLILTDASGYELAHNDDAAGDTKDAAITDFTLPADGTYLIRATRYGFANGPSAGGYRLVIDTQAEPVDLGAEATPAALSYATPRTGALDLDHPGARYTISGRAGDRVTISVQRTDGDLDLALTLRDPDGAEIASSHAWVTPGEARIARLALSANGTYTVEVLLGDLTTSGTYRVIALSEPRVRPSTGAFEPAPGLDIEVVLIWSSGVDLDLAVTDLAGQPNGVVTSHANDFCTEMRPAPVERVVWNRSTAAPGLYRVSVSYPLNCAGQAEPVPFILALVRDGAVEFVGGTLAQEGDTYTTLLAYQ
jgi:hypothetical protein